MYNVSDAVEMGNAQELILSSIKEVLQADDTQQNTFRPSEYFEE
jgi:hypothetical protein